MAFSVDPNQFLVFFRDPGRELTPDRLKQALLDARNTVAGDAPPFTVRFAGGPAVSVTLERGEVAEVLALRLMGRDREFRPLAKGCDIYIRVAFDDLDVMQDEANTLIDLQLTLQTATNGLIYLSWNRHFMGLDEWPSATACE